MKPYKEILRLERAWKLALADLQIVTGGSSMYHTMCFMACLLCFAESNCGVLKGKFYRVMSKLGEKSIDSIKSYTHNYWIEDGLIRVEEYEGHKGTEWFYPTETLIELGDAFSKHYEAFDCFPDSVVAPYGYVPELLNNHYEMDKKRAESKMEV